MENETYLLGLLIREAVATPHLKLLHRFFSLGWTELALPTVSWLAEMETLENDFF